MLIHSDDNVVGNGEMLAISDDLSLGHRELRPSVGPALNTVDDAVRQVLKLDWWAVPTPVKDVSKCCTMVAGEQCAITSSAILMHRLPAFSWDLGTLCHVA